MTDTEPRRAANDEEIRALWRRACDAWTRGDARAYGETFTADVDYVPFDGSLVRGREAVIENHDRLFRGVLTGSALVGDIESIRYVHGVPQHTGPTRADTRAGFLSGPSVPSHDAHGSAVGYRPALAAGSFFAAGDLRSSRPPG